MTPQFAALIGLLVGGFVGWVATALIGRRCQAQVDEPPPVPPALVRTVRELPTPAFVAGPHDEVLAASRTAVDYGLVRGSRVADPTALADVRSVRRRDEAADGEWAQARGLAGPRIWALRTFPLGGGLVGLVAEDRAGSQRIDRTVQDFVANISHELKTPIGAITLLAEAVEDGADDPEAVRHFAGRMATESKRLNDLVSQVIALTRLQSEDPLSSADRVDVDEIVAEAVDRFRTLADSRSIILSVAGETGLAVTGDRDQLVTALANLVQNAIVYSDARARVTVSARVSLDDHEQVEILVSDNGIGIAEADAERIFERFFRVDYARSRENGGTGLGLSIVRHVAEAHGGRASVWSRPGQGSTFTLTLPIRSADIVESRN